MKGRVFDRASSVGSYSTFEDSIHAACVISVEELAVTHPSEIRNLLFKFDQWFGLDSLAATDRKARLEFRKQGVDLLHV